MKVACKAIDIIGENLSVPLAMHVCGNLDNVFKDLIKFSIDILDCEFAGNDINIKILEENSSLIRNKKIGFGCLDTSINEVDSKEKIKGLKAKGVEILGKDNMILDPDCGLRRATKDVAFNKLKLMNSIKDEYS